MGYLLMNEDQKSIVKLIHEFLGKNLDPIVAELDQRSEFPIEIAR